MNADRPRTVAGLLEAFAAGTVSPSEVAADTMARLESHGDDAIWIGEIDADHFRSRMRAPAAGPLGGVPFAVKDNIDVEGTDTTAGCPEFAHRPDRSAVAVEHLERAGAAFVGKTNLDQFATGLVGTRSPYGTPRNPFDAAFVPGGSSSGSAVAVSTGLVPFALGTDTAGSGRIPAALGNIVGHKPTLGLVSTTGVTPACRSLDCVSVFALTGRDAALIFDVLDRLDEGDVYARPTSARAQRRIVSPDDVVVGIPSDSILARCDLEIADAFVRHANELELLGIRTRTIDLEPFLEAGTLLYDGPWIAEREAAVGAFIDAHPNAVLDVTRDIVLGARRFNAADAFLGEYRRRELVRRAAVVWADVDAIVVPSVPAFPTLAEVAADPLGVNARLGLFSTFVNLLDLCAVAVPGGFLASGLPVGYTMIAPACSDRFLLDLTDRYQRMVDRPLGAIGGRLGTHASANLGEVGGDTVALAVVGAHLSGQPLNGQLVERGARLAARTTTSAAYRLVALTDAVPPKPGLARTASGGSTIEVEVWDVPIGEFGSFVAGVPAPLAIGKLELADGSWVSGFVCEPHGIDGALDITDFGGWRSYLDRRRSSG